jgi:hypothetical protein
VRQTGAKRLTLYDRLGITLVILGMIQSFAPTCFRPTRPSLRINGRLKLAIALPDLADASATLSLAGPTLPSEPERDQESDQESHDTEDLAETFTWSEAITIRRPVQRFMSVATLGPAPIAGQVSERTRSALQQEWANAVLASSSATMTARLCRMIC